MALGIGIVALLLLAALGSPLPAAHGQGNWPCDQDIVDQAGLLTSQMSEVRSAMDALVQMGAEVRVFTVKTTGQGNLDPYVDNIWNGCPSWRSGDGQQMKNNLIVIGISLEEQRTGLYYGETWLDLLDPEYLRIQSDLMNPRFRAGDFAGGIIAGLQEIGRLIEASRPVGSPTVAPSTAVPIAAPAAGGGTAAGLIVAGVIAAAVVGVGAVGGGVAISRQRAARRQAQQRAREAKSKFASRVLALQEQLTFLQVDMENLAREMPAQELQGLQGQLVEARRLAGQSSTDYESLQTAGSDPDREGLSRQEYEGQAASYEMLLETLGRAGQMAGEAQQKAAELKQLAAQVPAALEQAQGTIAQNRAQVEEHTRELANKRSAWLLEEAQARLDQARAAGAGKDPRQALALTAEAVSQAGEAVTTAGLLPALRQRLEQMDGAIDAGAATFEQMTQQYAESAWQAVRGNGTEAENRLTWAGEALQRAGDGLASAEEGNWPDALEQVKQANAWLDEANGLIASIHEQLQRLEKARQDLPQEISAAREDLQRAREYIGQYDPDIREELERDLEAAQQDLQQAESGPAQPDKPDSIQLITLAQQAHTAADHILEQARDEHEAIARLREQLASGLRDSAGAVSRARHYVEDHGHDVGGEACDAVTTAGAALDDAERKRALADEQEDTTRRQTLSEAVTATQRAKTLADEAYTRAQQDIRRAEARRAATRSTYADGVLGGWGTPRSWPHEDSDSHSGGKSIFSSGSSHSSSSGSSGGGSSSWGRSSSSSRSSGGGSTRWGGAARPSRPRGGGSTGW